MASIDVRLLRAEDQTSLPGVLATAFCRALSADRPLGEARSNADGFLSIDVGERMLKRITEGRLDVEFSFAAEDGTALQPFGSAVWNAAAAAAGLVTISIGVPAERPAGFSVAGRVVLGSGVALPDAPVEALDITLGRARKLGSAITGRDGGYRIEYTVRGKEFADLRVRVRNAAGKVIAESPVAFQADPHASIDLVVAEDRADRPSEYTRLAADARAVADAPLTGLDADAVGYLAGRTGWDARAVAMAVRAADLAQQSQIPAAHYYALLRAGLPDDPQLLHLRSEEEIAAVLKAAVASGLIDPADDIDATLVLHRAAALSALATRIPEGAASSMGDMLALRLDEDAAQRFLTAYRDTGGRPDRLWQRLRDDGFDDGTIAALRNDGALGTLTAQNAPVVRRLARAVKSPADLAAKGFFEAAAWDSVIADDTPRGVTKEQYARAMALQVRLAQPTLVTAELVARGTIALTDRRAAADLADFLRSAGPRDLGRVPVQQWRAYRSLDPQLQAEARRVQRLYQISPSDDAMARLARLGLDSARAVADYDGQTFVQRFGAELGESTALAVHTKAREVHESTINLATSYVLAQKAPSVHVLAAPQPPAGSATLEELLGSLDYCACEECRSVLSPAAYLVDLLEFLDSGAAPTPQQALLARRPDLERLLLSCENTNTRLPYVDLVNEILEHWVVNGSLAGYTGHDTQGPSDDLLADPQYVLDAAYTDTAARVWPVPLPFDMPLAHLRSLFASWTLPLADALQAFGTPADARRERLGLNARAWQLLTDESSYDLAECFGEPAGADLAAIADGATLSRRLGVTYTELHGLLRSRFVNPGSALLPRFEALGATFAQVRADNLGGLPAADAAWVRANSETLLATLVLHADEGAQPCDFSAVALQTVEGRPPGAAQWQRLHRFVRLWRTLGWPMQAVDDAVVALMGDERPPDDAMAATLARLANLRTVMQRRGAGAKQLPQWLSALGSGDALARLLRIGTTDLANLAQITGFDAGGLDGDDPGLLRLERAAAAVKASPLKVSDVGFLLRHEDPTGALSAAPDVRPLREALNAVEAELAAAAADPDLASVAQRAAVIFDADSVAALFALVQGTTTYRAGLASDVANLPLRHASLGFDSFASQLTFTGVLDDATLAELAGQADGLRQADVPEVAGPAALAAYVAGLKAALQDLHDQAAADIAGLEPALAAMFAAGAAETEPSKQARAILDALLPDLRRSTRTAAVRSVLGATLKLDPGAVAALAADAAVLASAGAPLIDDLLALDAPIGFDADAAFAITAPATDEYIFAIAAPPGTAVTLEVAGSVVIAATVGASGEARSAPVKLVGGVLTAARVTLPVAAQLRWRTRAQAMQRVPAAQLTDGAALAAAQVALQRLQVAAALVRALRLAAADISHLGGVEPTTKGLFDALDIDGSVSGSDLHEQWARLEQVLWFASLKAAVEPEPGALARALTGRPDALAAMLGQPAADIDAALAHLGKTRDDLGALPVLRAVREAGALAGTALQPAADLIAWTRSDPDGPHVRGIVAALKARLDAASWRDAMKQVADPLRNQRREALVADILAHHRPAPGIATADQLYEHLLVDVQMDACAETSRIRLALSSVQLFVMRCLLDLEPGVPASAIRADRWEWMKRYRVWEANRKIFLYPENWLEPELRDGKSPFFTELEGDLLKADITDDLAEQAYLSYLRKLDEIARLEVVGAFLEERVTGDPDDDVLHVIGRTGGTKRQHWYRSYDQTWSPWEKVSLSVDGDLVFPVVWRKQLFLFWCNTLVKSHEQPSGTGLQAIGAETFTARSDVDVEITLHWGERYKGRWSTPRSTETRFPIRFEGLSSFDPSRLEIAGRTAQPFPDAPERLVLGLTYREGWLLYAATVTFTTKHAPPHVAYSVPVKVAGRPYGIQDDVLRGLDARVRQMWSADAPGTALDTDAYRYQGSKLQAHISQPQWSTEDVRTQDIITKTDRLTPGMRLRPLRHPTVNPFEAPFFYSDEHSVFFAGATEHITDDQPWYFLPWAIPQEELVVPYIPPLYEHPVVPDLLGPVAVGPRIDKVIATGKPFAFNGTPVGADGQGF